MKGSLAISGLQDQLKPQSVNEIQKKLELSVLAKRLTSWEARFVDYVIMGDDEITALDKAGCPKVFKNDKEKREFAKKTLEKYDVKRYLISALDMFTYLAPRSIANLSRLANESSDERVKLEANKFIVEKALEQGGQSKSLPVTLNITLKKENDKTIKGEVIEENLNE